MLCPIGEVHCFIEGVNREKQNLCSSSKAAAMSKPVMIPNQSAEKDGTGKEYLSSEPWQKMGTQTVSSRATAYLDKMVRKVTGDLEGEDLIRVLWLSSTLFFIVGGYWLLRSLKDPIMSVINGVSAVNRTVCSRVD